MANVQDPPSDNPGNNDPGSPGYNPGTGPDTRLSVITTNSAYTFTEEAITAAGGPWASFTVRVTPINDNGVGPYQEVTKS